MCESKIQIYSEMILSVVFIVVIFAPPITTLFSPGLEISDLEKRKLAVMPHISLSKRSLEEFPSGFEAYYNDHFGLRRTHLIFNNYVKAKILKSSPVSKVLIGKDNWLYIVRAHEIEDFQGLMKARPIQLEAWKANFRSKRDWLASRGIRYLYVPAPSKKSIYPEYLPDYVKRIEYRTLFDQLLEYLDGEFSQEILDLRLPLLDGKEKEKVYYRADTHWNQNGAYIVYQSILGRMQSWFPDEKTLTPVAIDKTTKIYKGMGLSTMLGLPEDYSEEGPLITLRQQFARPQKDMKLPQLFILPQQKPFAMECPNGKLRAVVFRDSFFSAIVPFISENFKEVIYIWYPFDREAMTQILEYYQPDIVIEENAESFLFFLYSDEYCKNILAKAAVENH